MARVGTHLLWHCLVILQAPQKWIHHSYQTSLQKNDMNICISKVYVDMFIELEICLSLFSFCHDKIVSNQSNLREKGFILALGSKHHPTQQASQVYRSLKQQVRWLWKLGSREGLMYSAAEFLFSVYSDQDTSQGIVLPTVGRSSCLHKQN